METIDVLLVEDEPTLSMIIRETLELRGFTVRTALNGVEGWTSFKQRRPDICVIDVMMPRKDGHALLADIRKIDEWLPVIFLTAKNQNEDVLKGFELGADDYMKKPFSMEELIHRLNRLVRRSNNNNTPAPISSDEKTFNIGKFTYQPERLTLQSDDQVLRLSQRENELLQLLLEHKGQLLGRETALIKIWGDVTLFNARSMDVYITRLRKFLAPDPDIELQNVRGKGYKLLD